MGHCEDVWAETSIPQNLVKQKDTQDSTMRKRTPKIYSIWGWEAFQFQPPVKECENWSVIENIDPTDGLIITLAETASYMNKKLSELLRDQSYHPFILMEGGSHREILG